MYQKSENGRISQKQSKGKMFRTEFKKIYSLITSV